MNRSWFFLFLTPIISYAAYPAYEGKWKSQQYDQPSYLEEMEAEEFDDFNSFAYEDGLDLENESNLSNRSSQVAEEYSSEEDPYEERLYRESQEMNKGQNTHRAPRRSSRIAEERSSQRENRQRAPQRSSRIAEERSSQREQALEQRENRQRAQQRSSRIAEEDSSQREQALEESRLSRKASQSSSHQGRPRITQRKEQKKSGLQSRSESSSRRKQSSRNAVAQRNTRGIPQRSQAVKAKPYAKNRVKSHHPGKRPLGQ